MDILHIPMRNEHKHEYVEQFCPPLAHFNGPHWRVRWGWDSYDGKFHRWRRPESFFLPPSALRTLLSEMSATVVEPSFSCSTCAP
eukprot:427228-Ditylum_brightwellii.AAC.1